MKVNELFLPEETLQAALKRLFKKGGSLQQVAGDQAEMAAQMLKVPKTAAVYSMKAESPMTSRLVKSVGASAAYNDGADDNGNEMKLVYPQPGLEPEQFAGLNFDHFFLQPMDGPDREPNTRLAIDYCLAHPQWRLSLQTHKLTGIP